MFCLTRSSYKYKRKNYIIKINNFRGDLSEISDQKRLLHCCTHVQEKFASYLNREAKNSKETDKVEGEERDEMASVFKKFYHVFVPVFVFYCCSASGSSFHMSLNAFTQFLDDCCIPDVESQSVKRSDLDTVFIVANFQACSIAVILFQNQNKHYLRYFDPTNILLCNKNKQFPG